MIVIDKIVEKMNGHEVSAYDMYNAAREWYSYIYNKKGEEAAENSGAARIMDAFDAGTNKDIQNILCEYVNHCYPNPFATMFIKNTDWLGEYA